MNFWRKKHNYYFQLFPKNHFINLHFKIIYINLNYNEQIISINPRESKISNNNNKHTYIHGRKYHLAEKLVWSKTIHQCESMSSQCYVYKQY